MNKTKILKEPSKPSIRKDMKRLLKSIEQTSVLSSDMMDLCEGEWSASLSVKNGCPIINVHGPDCDVWARSTFAEEVNSFVDTDDEYRVRNLPIWIRAVEDAAKNFREELAESERRILAKKPSQ